MVQRHTSLRRVIRAILILLISLIVLYGVALAVGAIIPSGRQPPAEGDSFIYLIDNGVHVELCLPAERAPESLPSLLGQQEKPFLYCFGWGDRYFYPGTPSLSDLELIPSLKAIFLPTGGTIGITWYGNYLIEGEHVRRVEVTSEQIDLLYGFILSYLTDSALPDENVSPGYDEIRFFEAGGTYSLFFTCNNWTNRALRYAGIPSHLWTPTTWGVGP